MGFEEFLPGVNLSTARWVDERRRKEEWKEWKKEEREGERKEERKGGRK